jgi:TrmH family RNA methyltransferase
MVVDGPRLVGEAIDAGLEVEELFAAPGMVEQCGLGPRLGPGTELFDVPADVLSAVLDPINPSPLAAVVRSPTWALDDLALDLPVVVAVELRDPGNLGTVVRTAEAAGFGGVVIAGDSVDASAPKVVRASAGSIFRTPVVYRPDVLVALDELRANGRSVMAAVVDPDAEPYDQVDLTTAAIVVGNEPRGLADDVVAAADIGVTIPVASSVESLNVAAAASVLCFEAARQRRSRLHGR